MIKALLCSLIILTGPPNIMDDEVTKNLHKVSQTVNKNCPIIVDNITTLISTAVIGKRTFLYKYQMDLKKLIKENGITLKKYYKIKERIKKEHKKKSQNAVCTDPAFKYVRDHNVTMSYSYSDTDGIFQFAFKISKDQCE
jgi:hypothetical protein